MNWRREVQTVPRIKNVNDEARITRAMIFRKFYLEPKKTQAELVVDYINRYGSITALEAAEAFSCYSLAERIRDLRHKGVAIKTVKDKSGKFSAYELGGAE